jgi:NADH:ubiquinone oxidoreductase subunit 4 (subunit M)
VLVLAVAGILYAALLAMGQSDMKRLVSYTSISHFGFIALGIFAFTTEGTTGAVLYMVNHGLATGLLFIVVGMLIARGGSRQIRDYGGVAAKAPVLAGVFLLAGLASLALPGTNSFVSEFLVLIGSFRVRPVFAILATVGIVLAVVGVLYAALLAMGQSDMKRLVSYTSISHFGFIALGIFAFTQEGATGAVLYMVNHGIATGLLFIVVGMLIARGGSRQIRDYGGVAAKAPLLGGVFLLAGLASLALPGTNSFVSEFLVLIGSFPSQPVFTIIGTAGIILAALYILLMYQRTMQGPPAGVLMVEESDEPGTTRGSGATAVLTAPRRTLRVLDLDRRELAVVTPLVALIIVLGVYPQPMLNLIEPAVSATMSDLGGSHR